MKKNCRLLKLGPHNYGRFYKYEYLLISQQIGQLYLFLKMFDKKSKFSHEHFENHNCWVKFSLSCNLPYSPWPKPVQIKNTLFCLANLSISSNFQVNCLSNSWNILKTLFFWPAAWVHMALGPNFIREILFHPNGPNFF
jgi:hypothetical protein